ncbi:DUF1826 domain-containing protein [Archangium minus]|uniref:DUF1826 domain-containing protein n=1 Tax=Archangium minus TaxID=83450 RepID=A0ABY9WT85_9BACT|nr:DUF1826 domain-containing protein [Archangium minus]
MSLPATRLSPPSVITVEQVADLTAIFEKHLNVCVWERPADAALAHWLEEVCATYRFLQVRETRVGDAELGGVLAPLPDSPGRERFRQELAGLVELYADLFDAERVGLRLGTLDAPMCPRFHVDRVGVRLVCTYKGAGTEYLDEADVQHSPLDARPGAVPRRMAPFAVGLLKGEAWPGNQGQGAVHRSPPGSELRMFLSLDLL